MQITGSHLLQTVPAWAMLLVCACGPGEPRGGEVVVEGSTNPEVTMKFLSAGFQDGGRLDPRFTVEGDDLSPPLAWSGAPAETKSFALICDDPDAPSPRHPATEPWVHWVLFNIPADASGLPEGIGREPEPAEVPGARQGRNSWPSDNVGYRGPAPPPGSGQHRYVFKVYALDAMLELGAKATKQQLLTAMAGHVVAEGRLIGVYQR